MNSTVLVPISKTQTGGTQTQICLPNGRASVPALELFVRLHVPFNVRVTHALNVSMTLLMGVQAQIIVCKGNAFNVLTFPLLNSENAYVNQVVQFKC